MPRHITGHIDFLQARNGAIHILDYKPDARTNKPIAQLTAWFNENCYNEFFPRLLLPRPEKTGV
jgi:hypothetical protein